MAPFLYPRAVLSSFKEKIDSLIVQGGRLYIGTSTGNLHIYSINNSPDEDEEVVTSVEVKKSLTRRSIEQLGFIKDINSLVVLSEDSVTLFPLPTFSPPTPLVKTKTAFSFAVHTSIQHIAIDDKSDYSSGTEFARPKPIPTRITQLLVGCRRKVVLYSWRDGEAQEVKEAPLPHSPRAISFLNHDAVCFAYPPPDYAIFSTQAMSAAEISTPLPVTASTSTMGALTGLTGYMTLGLGAKALKPPVVTVNESETLIAKDDEGLFIGADAKVSRTATIAWPAPPEELAFLKPYVFSVLPPGTVHINPVDASPTGSTQQVQTLPQSQPLPSFIPTSVVQIHSSLSLLTTQTIPFPFSSPSSGSNPVLPTPSNATIRLMTSSPSGKSLFLVTTPTDKAAAATEGRTIWQFDMKPWAEQIDELVQSGQYADALALLGTLQEAVLPDKVTRRTLIRALNAVSEFRASKFDSAIDTFLELHLNPAKVIALYPESVAGRLSVPQDGWITLLGGPAPTTTDDSSISSEKGSQEQSSSPAVLLDALTTPAESIRSRLGRTGLGVFLPSSTAIKEPDTASLSGKPPHRGLHDDLHRSVETLLRYLTDHRPKLAPALAAVHITPQNQSDGFAPLSEIAIEELFSLPNLPLSGLTPEQLLRYAQVIDTALYKSYLIIRPALLRSFCRIPNWCEVSEVEEDFHARQKFAELIDLYHGKKMHAKALNLLRQLSENQNDMEDKLAPSIRYLQKLGPEHLQQIFESSRWIFDMDSDMAFEIFTSEDVELPRREVVNYLDGINPKLSVRYLEYIIGERHEISPEFHDRLADLYFSMTLSTKKRGEETPRQDAYTKLLHFIESDQYFGLDRLYGLLSSTDLFEARAILLGRLGRHDQALELYVYRMHDYRKAEEYCQRVYQPGSETDPVFLTLLRMYLRPTVITTSDFLKPALELITRHNLRLDSVETLQLLPPLVTAQNVHRFLIEALRAPIFDTAVNRHISKARNDQVSRKLMILQSRRVKVTDSRICPQCHKRINSVIAVHSPRGEVTHYQCRELFARKLNELK